jgi:hypothetical protein
VKMKDKIILKYVERQNHAAQGEGYSKSPGYEIWYQERGTDEMLFLQFIRKDLLETALWFYMQEKELDIYIDDGKNVTASRTTEW